MDAIQIDNRPLLRLHLVEMLLGRAGTPSDIVPLAAMLRVVEAAEEWDRSRTKGERERAYAADALTDAVRRYRQATGRDTYGRALDGEATP